MMPSGAKGSCCGGGTAAALHDLVRTEASLRALVDQGRGNAAFDPIFEALLRESNPLYAGKSTPEITRCRGWLLLALASGDLGESSLPFVLEELESAHDAYLSAVAARVLRSALPRPEFVPPLQSALLYLRFRDEAFDLESYGGHTDGPGSTTARVEVVKALAWLGALAKPARAQLEELRSTVGAGSPLAQSVESACAALDSAKPHSEAFGSAAPWSGSALTAWDANPAPGISGVELEDQSGECSLFGDFFEGSPAIVGFFYTRCDNPTKCPLTIAKLGRVQRLLRDRGIEKRVRTAAITYDPGFDRPERLHRFGETWGFEAGSDHRLFRSTGSMDELQTHFQLGVSYAGSIPSRHQLEVFVLDAEGRIDGTVQRRQWNEAELVGHAEPLIAG